ncbi:MAG: translation initiation factor [Fidelibacterota bacterium]|jgi:translation initiation factor 1|nr:translation initiation factor [Candidatus Neomarinimicrobiota bacterium]|tara:strand:- start:189 stop:506 length:318 start_codon:yes stop_codon:yes gene_type:complete
MKKNIVYSTDLSFEIESSNNNNKKVPNNQDLRIHLDRRKAGKIVTIIKGFNGSRKQLEEYATLIKKKCGVGGSVKNNEILIQGNVREFVISLLNDDGHIAKPSGG